ncbi:MAG: hypothetical protein AAFP04_09600 [Myxococcota bacterium]
MNLNLVRRAAVEFFGEAGQAALGAAGRQTDAARAGQFADDLLGSATPAAARPATAVTSAERALAPQSFVDEVDAAVSVAQRAYNEALEAYGSVRYIPDSIRQNLDIARATQTLVRRQRDLASTRPGGSAFVSAQREVADAHNRLGDTLVRSGSPEEAVDHYRLAGQYFEARTLELQSAGQGMRVAPNNSALHSFAAAGDVNGVFRAVDRHAGQYVGATAAILRQARANGDNFTSELRRSAQATYDRAVTSAQNAGRPHPFDGQSLEQLWQGVRSGELNGIDLQRMPPSAASN